MTWAGRLTGKSLLDIVLTLNLYHFAHPYPHPHNISLAFHSAYAWVHSVECAKQNCMFIAVTAMVTNKLGNFKVEPGQVTPANCNEAQCEQGNPGRFAELSGASRRKMNIPSDIARPKDQQCQIIGAVPEDEKGFSNWTGYFEPLCPRSASPP